VTAALNGHLPDYTVVNGREDKSTGGVCILVKKLLLSDFKNSKVYTADIGGLDGNIIMLQLNPYGERRRPTTVVAYYGKAGLNSDCVDSDKKSE